MNLPNYFLADLPPGATLTPEMITEACRTLKRNREKYLAARSTQDRVELLCAVAERWLDSNYPFRRLALETGPAATGFSRATLEKGLDGFFNELTPENFHALLLQDLGHMERLDRFVRGESETSNSHKAMARGPELVMHIAAGNIPSSAWTHMVLGVLVRSAQFVKCASGASLLPRLFAHSLYDAEPKLGACLEVAEWRGGHEGLENALFDEADCVTATGSDETLEAIQRRLKGRARFLGYGHRVSFAYVTGDMVSSFHAKKTVARAAQDVVAWNQLGCLSPHVIYAENAGAFSAEHFAEMLAEELATLEASEPRGPVSTETAAGIASRRAFYEVRAAHSPDTRFWRSENSTAWTVVYESDPRFQLSCLNRFVYVKRAENLTQALEAADAVRGKVSTVGIAAPAQPRQ